MLSLVKVLEYILGEAQNRVAPCSFLAHKPLLCLAGEWYPSVLK